MANKYEEGSYHIIYFDEFGSKLTSKRADNQSLTGARHEANEHIKSGNAGSYVIYRVLDNSKVKKERWQSSVDKF